MTRVWHLYPPGDLIEHELTEDCVCGPEVRLCDGGGWLYIHFSLDGRKENEDEDAAGG